VRPEVIITDIAMPQMDGYEFSRTLRQRAEPGSVKIIALTAFPVGSISAQRKEFDAYLAKPIDPFELVEVVATVVAPSGESRSESAL
jgi:CheY-like chemotaxis protein